MVQIFCFWLELISRAQIVEQGHKFNFVGMICY
jgi:hypothetical protein